MTASHHLDSKTQKIHATEKDLFWVMNRAAEIKLLYSHFGGRAGLHTSETIKLCTRIKTLNQDSKSTTSTILKKAIDLIIRDCNKTRKKYDWGSFITILNNDQNCNFYARCLMITLYQIHFASKWAPEYDVLPQRLQLALEKSKLTMNSPNSLRAVAAGEMPPLQPKTTFFGSELPVKLISAGMPPALLSLTQNSSYFMDNYMRLGQQLNGEKGTYVEFPITSRRKSV